MYLLETYGKIKTVKKEGALQMSETVRNNEFYKAAADNLMISDSEDKANGKPFSLLTLYEGELVTLRFNKESVLVVIDISTTINTELITDTEWISIHSNKDVRSIISRFSKTGCGATFSEVLALDKAFDCRHNAYTSTFGDASPVPLGKFIERLNELREADVKRILKAKCFNTTIKLDDIMFWEER
ncbi:hypothetical protein DIRTYBETTY_156 [Bacillus phage DirtyBetty]|uniref:Uncharacterized protein n=3 Tax=Wphvirus megatron TaxID=1987728 RepID=A0A1B1PAW3_9CAUD|nr:hypothetical protein BIZ88_gp156 [Bacillus phage DirtyBetty]ANT41301.1 hypothetical protein DIRTYBETTY_156 [Bacillus phage DirtyBetty]